MTNASKIRHLHFRDSSGNTWTMRGCCGSSGRVQGQLAAPDVHVEKKTSPPLAEWDVIGVIGCPAKKGNVGNYIDIVFRNALWFWPRIRIAYIKINITSIFNRLLHG